MVYDLGGSQPNSWAIASFLVMREVDFWGENDEAHIGIWRVFGLCCVAHILDVASLFALRSPNR